VEDLNLLSRVLHMFQAASIEDGFGILIAIKKKYDEGGMKRQRHTLIPLTFKAFGMFLRVYYDQLLIAQNRTLNGRRRCVVSPSLCTSALVPSRKLHRSKPPLKLGTSQAILKCTKTRAN
jgi:hypothetical protein